MDFELCKLLDLYAGVTEFLYDFSKHKISTIALKRVCFQHIREDCGVEDIAAGVQKVGKMHQIAITGFYILQTDQMSKHTIASCLLPGSLP